MNCDVTALYPLGLRIQFLYMSFSTKSLAKCLPFARRPCPITKNVKECRATSVDDRFDQKCPEMLEKAENCWLRKNEDECPLEQEMNDCFGKPSLVHLRCLEEFERRCRSYKIRATKVNRLSMQNIEGIIREMPDIYIVFYIRDPRPTWLSRAKVSWNLPIRSLCDQMLNDYQIFEVLSKKYPGVFIKVKYEDLAESPVTTAEKIYNHFGEDLPTLVNIHLSQITHNTELTEENWKSIYRIDSNKTAHAWRKFLREDDILLNAKSCRDYLLVANYKI